MTDAGILDLGMLGRINVSCPPEGALEAAGQVPEDLELFRDHFPEFPVLPGVLSLEIIKKTAEFWLSRQPSQAFRLREIGMVKFGSFLRPGDRWHLRLTRESAGGEVSFRGRLSQGDRTAVNAALTFEHLGS